MTAFYSSLATLLISYTIYRFPGVIFGIVCAHLFGNHCLEYLRKRRFHRILKQLTNSNMESSVPVQDRPGIMIGAWGFKFFESDHDYDIVGHLSADMGMCTYNPRGKMQDSLLNPEDRDFVIKHIQKPTELDRVFKKYLGMLQNHKVIDIQATRNEGMMIDSPRYYIFLLGLLAMQLGCTLSRKHRRWMKANWNGCLFMYERLDQAKMAAFEYQNGEPLKMGSKTLCEKGATLAANEELNVPNNALPVSIMRMHLDNEAAKSKGATATNGVDISNAFASDAADIAALEQAAAAKAKDSAGEDRSVPKTPKVSVRTGAKITQWASNQVGWDRLKQHKPEDSAASVRNANSQEMTELLAELIKHRHTGGA